MCDRKKERQRERGRVTRDEWKREGRKGEGERSDVEGYCMW